MEESEAQNNEKSNRTKQRRDTDQDTSTREPGTFYILNLYDVQPTDAKDPARPSKLPIFQRRPTRVA